MVVLGGGGDVSHERGTNVTPEHQHFAQGVPRRHHVRRPPDERGVGAPGPPARAVRDLPHPTPPHPTRPALPRPGLPYPTLPYPSRPYPSLPYPTLPYPTLFYPTLPHLARCVPLPGDTSSCSGRGCVKSLRSSYMGLYPQGPLHGDIPRPCLSPPMVPVSRA